MARQLKSHCGRGHAMSGENVGHWKDGNRYCRTCKRESNRISELAKKARRHGSETDKRYVWAKGPDPVCSRFLRMPLTADMSRRPSSEPHPAPL